MTRDGGAARAGLTPPDDIRHRQMRWNAAEQMWETRALDSVNKDVKRWKGRTTDQTAFAGQSGTHAPAGSRDAIARVARQKIQRHAG